MLTHLTSGNGAPTPYALLSAGGRIACTSKAFRDQWKDKRVGNQVAETSEAITYLLKKRNVPEHALVAIIRSLLDAGANPASGDALHVAAVLGLPRVTALLLGYGADVDARNAGGKTPLG